MLPRANRQLSFWMKPRLGLSAELEPVGHHPTAEVKWKFYGQPRLRSGHNFIFVPTQFLK